VGTLSLRVRYRPVRIGWCIEFGKWDQLQVALRLTHTLAGGRYNPFIPVETPDLAEALMDRFRVDLLYPLSQADCIQAFVKSHNYLLWPEMKPELFHERWQHIPPRAAFADVWHAAWKLRELRLRRRKKALLLTFEDDDPLAPAILAMAGGYPLPSDKMPDYCEMLRQLLGLDTTHIGRGDQVPAALRMRLTPSRLTTLNLEADRPAPDHGVYIGSAADFDDVLNFWNLRAAGCGLVFFDPQAAERLTPLLESHKQWLASIPAQPWQKGRIIVYGRNVVGNPQVSMIGANTIGHEMDVCTWNGLNLKPAIHHWKDQAVLGSIDETDRRPSVTFPLPEKPIYDTAYSSEQQLVATVIGSDPWTHGRDWTFFPPYVPELNEYYARNLFFDYARLRIEPPAIWRLVSLIVHNHDTSVTLRALPPIEVAQKLFEQFGIESMPSQPGLVTSRLIAQMGGVQGCRVFKIEGVRKLIGKYSPDQSFGRTEAIKLIGNFDETTSRARFERFESLFIAPRPHRRKLQPQDALDFLLERGVFRVGLDLKCPHCELSFWQLLDDVKTKMECLYCGTHFDVTGQLRDRNWAYRRSGLFGRSDHQRGGIPVAVTIQQLDATLHADRMLYTTSLELSPAARTAIGRCETDFVIITSGYSDHYPDQPQLLIGECKTSGTITAQDVEHLAKVADALPHRRLNVFLVFAKTGKFSDEEVATIAAAQDKWRSRIILMSQDELEPYFMYERHPQEPRLQTTGVEDLAANTVHLFRALRPKGPAELRAEETRRAHSAAAAIDSDPPHGG
jgi:hypothetical protein